MSPYRADGSYFYETYEEMLAREAREKGTGGAAAAPPASTAAPRLTTLADIYFFYNNYLGRDPEWGVEAGGAAEAEGGRIGKTYDDVMKEISNSEEARNRLAAGYKPPKDPATGLPWGAAGAAAKPKDEKKKTTKTTAGRHDPSPTLPGVNRGEQEDFEAMVKATMSRLGISIRDPLDSEIVMFAKSKWTADLVENYYRNLPEFVAQQPGLPYGLSREDYIRTRAEMESMMSQQFGTAGTGSISHDTEPSWLRKALEQKMSAGELMAGTADQFKRGTAKGAGDVDVAGMRGRSTQHLQDDRAGAGAKRTKVGPTVGELGNPQDESSPFARRK
jgi:hypothetical protein